MKGCKSYYVAGKKLVNYILFSLRESRIYMEHVMKNIESKIYQ